MKSNYSPWNINLDDFKDCKTTCERNKFLVRLGILAPSSHNAQPWKFSVGEEGIDVFLDEERTLTVGDADNRQAYISLGCAIENIVVAADYFGATAQVNLGPSAVAGRAARIELKYASVQAVNENKQQLAQAIIERVTNRNPYTNSLPPESFLSEISSLATEGERVFVFTDKQQKDQIAEISLAASVAATADKKFSQELSHYVKNNTTTSPTGMPGFGLGMPLLVSFIAPFLIRRVNINKLNHPHDKKLLQSNTSCLVILASQSDNIESWLRIGRLYEKIALQAVGQGLNLAMWASPIQIGEYYRDLQKVMQTDMRPQALFRIGYSTKTIGHSPRLSLEKVLK